MTRGSEPVGHQVRSTPDGTSGRNEGVVTIDSVTASSFRAFLADTKGEAVQRGVATRTRDDLPSDGVLVEVHWSSVNYKDGLASTPAGRVARISPIVPGIDLAGVVAESDDARFPVGAEVLAHGYDLGVRAMVGLPSTHGSRPTGSSLSRPASRCATTMVIGTAGYTAALSVVALEERGLTPADGPVLVTGATGGVGSTAVGILANRGYEVVASTGKADAEAYLRALGAKEIRRPCDAQRGNEQTARDHDVGGRGRLRREYDAGQCAAQDPLRRGRGVQRRDRRW